MTWTGLCRQPAEHCSSYHKLTCANAYNLAGSPHGSSSIGGQVRRRGGEHTAQVGATLEERTDQHNRACQRCIIHHHLWLQGHQVCAPGLFKTGREGGVSLGGRMRACEHAWPWRMRADTM